MAPQSKDKYFPVSYTEDTDSLGDTVVYDTETLLQQSEKQTTRKRDLLPVLTGICALLNIALLVTIIFLLRHPEPFITDQRCARQLSVTGKLLLCTFISQYSERLLQPLLSTQSSTKRSSSEAPKTTTIRTKAIPAPN